MDGGDAILRDVDVEARAEHLVRRLIEQWSEADQATWRNVYPEDPIALARLYGKHRPGWVVRKNIAFIVGRFQRYLLLENPIAAERPFVERVNVEQLLRFADELASTCSKGTVHEYLDLIVRYGQRCDRQWASRPCRRLIRQFRPRKRGGNRRRSTLHAFDIFLKADKELARIQQKIGTTPPIKFRRDADFEAYRNTLIIAWLSVMPLRLRNITEMAIGANLSRTFGGYRLSFTADEMKGREPIKVRVPDQLTERIKFYLEFVRPHLAKDVDVDAGRLWLTYSGHGFSPIGIHQVLGRTTACLLGERLSAHHFRYIVADTGSKAGLKLTAIAGALYHKFPSAVTEGYAKMRSMEALQRNRALFSSTIAKRQGAQSKQTIGTSTFTGTDGRR